MEEHSQIRRKLGALLVCLLLVAGTVFVTFRLLVWAGGALVMETPVELSDSILAEEDDFIADVRAAAEMIRQRWSYLELRRELSGVDVDQLEVEALDRLGESPDAVSFQRALTHLIAGLHDGHGGVIPVDYIVPGAYRWPFTITEVQEGFMLDKIGRELIDFAEETIDTLEIERGDLLIAVDDIPIDEWVSEAEQSVFASSNASRRRAAITRMARFDDISTRRFHIQRIDGHEIALEMKLPRSYKSIPDELEPAATRTHRMLEDRIGYFRPGDFSPPAESGWPGPPEERDAILANTYAEFGAVFEDLADARALILDLRNNRGGTDLLGQYLVDRLVEPGYVYSRLSGLGTRGWHDFSPGGSMAPPGREPLRTPLVCLIDERTFSTADNVAACLLDVHPNIRFAGRPNGAGSGAPRAFTLPRTGTQICFCTMRVQSPRGDSVEGISIPLDYIWARTRESVLSGRDTDLEGAIRIIEHGE